MLRNLFLRFGKRPSTDLDTKSSVCGEASPSTTPSRASHDNYKDNEGRSVHQLWPLEDHVRSTNFDVVFFHGLHWPSEKEAWKSTWTQLDDPQDCWPQNWLPQDLDENVRVLAISYDACPTQSEEKGSYDDVSEIGKNILQIVLSDEWRLGRQHGFVLIGHCFGGLGFKLVEKAAALRSARENYYTLEDCDHSTVCKPSAKEHPSYSLLLNVIRECRQEGPIKSNTYLGFECNWKENFQFYVDPSNLPNILLQKLVEGSNNILVYGGFGYGKTTLVKYVLYKNAEKLDTIFHGGIFHMRYGHKDNELLSCQKELIRALHLNPQELQGLECWQIEGVRAKLADLLNARSGPILLFIDDAWNGEMIDK
ncbi:unnamed protein product [Sphagnum tenellum]